MYADSIHLPYQNRKYNLNNRKTVNDIFTKPNVTASSDVKIRNSKMMWSYQGRHKPTDVYIPSLIIMIFKAAGFVA